jgi:hypothetical protein
MARHPDWFERLDAIQTLVSKAQTLQWLGRAEIKAIFECSERDSIRLLHKFGASIQNNALCLLRTALLTQLEALRSSSTYAVFLQKRHNVARHLTTAQAESTTRRFTVRTPSHEAPSGSELLNLPHTISWRRTERFGAGRFEVLYQDGADLMSQLAQFLSAAGVNQREFMAATEPDNEPAR